MVRGEIFATVPSALVQQKFKDVALELNEGVEFATEIRKLEGESCKIASMNYIESFTRETRKVTILQFGNPVQMNLYMYT